MPEYALQYGHLRFGKLNGHAPNNCCGNQVRISVGRPCSDGQQGLQPSGNVHFSGKHRLKIDRTVGGLFVDDDLPVGGQLLQCGLHRLEAQFELSGTAGFQLGPGQIGVPFFAGLLQQVAQTGLGALDLVYGQIGMAHNSVGNMKPDPGNIPGQPVGIVAQNFEGFTSIGLVNLCAVNGFDIKVLQECHQSSHRMVLAPGLLDKTRLSHTDARHFDQPVGGLLDDFQSLGREMGNQPFRGLETDSFDQSGTQIATDPLRTGRQQHLEGLDFELLAVPGMRTPAACQSQGLASLGIGYMSENRHHAGRFGQPKPGNQKMGLIVAKSDAFNLALDGCGIRFRGH